MRIVYEAVFTPDEEGFMVQFPDMPNCITCGNDLGDAVIMAADALEMLAQYEYDNGVALPNASFGRRAPEGGHVIAISVDVKESEPEYCSTSEAADLLNVTPKRVSAMYRDGVLPGIKIGRTVMVQRAAVLERRDNPRGAGRPKSQE